MNAVAVDTSVSLSPTTERTMRLRDGRTVAIRGIRPADAERLREFDGGLSEASRSFRYLGWMPRMSRDQALAMSTVDFRDSFALVAIAPSHRGEPIVADCRMAADSPGAADLAVAVADGYQDLGLGPALIRLLLATAAGQGLETVLAHVRADNAHMIHVLHGLGFRPTARELGVITFTARRPA